MDYMQGAMDAPRKAYINASFDKLGEPSPGAAGAVFYRDHFYDLIDDKRYYAPVLDNAKELVQKRTKHRLWRPDGSDCDSLVIKFGGDMIDAFNELGWEFPVACCRIKYDSISLAKETDSRFKAYHAAVLFWTWDPEKKDFVPYIVQPKALFDNGTTRDAVWAKPSQEINFWVAEEGIT